MPRLPQAPPPGVFRGATPLASAGRWFDANLVRFRQGQIQPMGGWVSLPGTSQTSPVRDIITWHDNSHVRWAAIGCDTGLFAYRFDTHAIYTITPAGVGPLDPPGAMTGWGTGTYGAAAYGTERDAADIGSIAFRAVGGRAIGAGTPAGHRARRIQWTHTRWRNGIDGVSVEAIREQAGIAADRCPANMRDVVPCDDIAHWAGL